MELNLLQVCMIFNIIIVIFLFEWIDRPALNGLCVVLLPLFLLSFIFSIKAWQSNEESAE